MAGAPCRVRASVDVRAQSTGLTTCTAYQPGTTIDDTHLVPGPGLVTKVRVRSGANPAPLRITIVKRIFQTHPVTGQITDAVCCTGTGSESATFQPPPNTVHEADAQPAAERDHVALTERRLRPPRHRRGERHGPRRPPDRFDRPAPAQRVQLRGDADVLSEGGDRAAGPGAARLRQLRRAHELRLDGVHPRRGRPSRRRRSRRRDRWRSAHHQGTRVLQEQGAAAEEGQDASKSLTIAGGKTKTITFKLSKKARKSVRKKSTNVALEVDLGPGGKATKNLKLKR